VHAEVPAIPMKLGVLENPVQMPTLGGEVAAAARPEALQLAAAALPVTQLAAAAGPAAEQAARAALPVRRAEAAPAG
jgi:hypothetical protein